MAQVLIRNLDKAIVDSLKTRAAMKGLSLEQELRAILTEAAKFRRDEAILTADRLRAMTPAGFDVDTTAMLREDRDRDN